MTVENITQICSNNTHGSICYKGGGVNLKQLTLNAWDRR